MIMDTLKKTSILMECGVCYEGFDEEKHRPAILQCSHSFCVECVVKIMNGRSKTCPTCRKSFQANSIDDLINRTLSELVKCINNRRARLAENTRGTSCSEWPDRACLKMQAGISILKKAKTKTEEAIEANEELTGEMEKIKKVIKEDIVVELKKIKERIEEITQKIRIRNDALKKNTRTIIRLQEDMEKLRSRMKDAKNFAAKGAVMDEIKDMEKTTERVLEEAILAIKTNRRLILETEKGVSGMQKRTTSARDILCSTKDEGEARKTDRSEDDGDTKDQPDQSLNMGATARPYVDLNCYPKLRNVVIDDIGPR
ncbi:E3 ubiquitin-protein ligase TRIM21-like [Palaemon carinicauda]|uniref:E3 ubiquitin-protein ligase TRIM21-like n=1 Tax=Palaemon carinicauda TaxID=392227 RepID=UPI0035B62136